MRRDATDTSLRSLALLALIVALLYAALLVSIESYESSGHPPRDGRTIPTDLRGQ